VNSGHLFSVRMHARPRREEAYTTLLLLMSQTKLCMHTHITVSLPHLTSNTPWATTCAAARTTRMLKILLLFQPLRVTATITCNLCDYTLGFAATQRGVAGARVRACVSMTYSVSQCYCFSLVTVKGDMLVDCVKRAQW
jgi:hypothetical protein